MKILILNSTTTYNYGTFMLLENFINHFDRISAKENRYFVYMTSDDDIPRINAVVNNPSHVIKLDYNFRKTENPFLKTYHIIEDYISGQRFLRKEKPDAVVVLGGDSLSEIYLGKKVLYYFYRFFRMSKRAPLFLLSQTIGPFHSKSVIRGMKRALANSHVYARDQWTIDYLKTFGITDVMATCDLAFLDLNRQNEHNDNLNHYSLTRGGFITIVPSGLYKHYHKSYESYVNVWRDVIKRLLATDELDSNKLVLLAHVHDSDRLDNRIVDKTIIEAILEDRELQGNDRIVLVLDEILPVDARTILGGGRFTISCRMHSSISSFQTLTPSISLSYSPKYKGVIGDELGCNDLVIDCKETGWNDSMINSIVEKAISIEADRESFVNRIELIMPKVKRKAQSQIDDMVRILEKLSE